ncbi:MAG: hypothetical protein ABI566_09865 [Pseudolysinimonas sp.]
MSTVWEVPVVERSALVLPRRLLRSVAEPLPRDARPPRSRHERLPAQLRVWGAVSRRIGT